MRQAILRILSLGCLFLFACQPYPDHVAPINDFRVNSLDFGTRRELRLLRASGNQESLLLEFNQPLHRLNEEDDPAPFELDFYPRLPVSRTVKKGIASVRVDFASTLPPAQRYSASIPVGWRALTGAAFLKAQEVTWETERPALIEVNYHDDSEGGGWRIRSNQRVGFDSLRSCLEVEEAHSGELLDPSELRLIQLGEQEFELSFPKRPSYQNFHLSLKPGLESLEGPLLGTGDESFPLVARRDTLFLKGDSGWQEEEGHLRLIFSAQVEERELLRSLKGLGAQSIEISSEDEQEYYLTFPQLKGKIDLTILKTLTAKDGSHLAREVSISLSNAAHQMTGEVPPRAFTTIRPKELVLPLKTPGKTKVTTWSLTEAQAEELLTLDQSEWTSSAKLAVEQTKPVYSATTKVLNDRTRMLSAVSGPRWTQNQRLVSFSCEGSSKVEE